MFGFAITPAIRVAAIFLAVVVVFTFGYYKGHSNEKEKFDAYRAEVTAAGIAQTKKTEVIEQAQTKVSTKAEVNHAKNSSVVSAVYSGLRLSASSRTVPKVPGASAQPDERAAYYVSVAPDLAEQCAQTTQQLTDLQQWVNDEVEVNR